MSRDACHARLLDAALDGAHPGYFDALPRELLGAARGVPVGRRMLLRRLTRQRPALAGLIALDAATLATHPWVLWDAAQLHGAAADLGAIALVPGLRACVDRPSVMRLRAAIGSERLAMALTFQAGEPIPDAVSALARRTVAGAIRDADAIAVLVARNGYRELAGYAERIHPAIGERVRLAFRPDWRAGPQGIWLSEAQVARYFTARTPAESAPDAVATAEEPDDAGEAPPQVGAMGEVAA